MHVARADTASAAATQRRVKTRRGRRGRRRDLLWTGGRGAAAASHRKIRSQRCGTEAFTGTALPRIFHTEILVLHGGGTGRDRQGQGQAGQRDRDRDRAGGRARRGVCMCMCMMHVY
jgi:hypothetical protein